MLGAQPFQPSAVPFDDQRDRALLQVALADPEAGAADLRAACEEALTLGQRQERLIDALLTLANGEKGIEQWESFDLADIAENVLVSRRPEAERRRITVHATTGHRPRHRRRTRRCIRRVSAVHPPDGGLDVIAIFR